MLELLATGCAGIFAGAAIYVSAVQHPAALQGGVGIAGPFFPLMYRRAAPMQAGLAVVGSLAGLGAWLSGSGIGWLVGAGLLAFVVAFTLLRIKPINDQLMGPGLAAGGARTAELLQQWGRLHWIRSASGTAAFAVFLLGWASG